MKTLWPQTKLFKNTLTFVAAALVTMPAFAATTVSIGEVTGIGVTQENISAAKAVLSNVLSARDDVIFKDAAPQKIDANILKLEQDYLLTAQLTQGSEIERTRRIKIDSLDELDIGMHRVVAALIEDVDVSATAERGSVIAEERKKPAQVHSLHGWEFALGGLAPLTSAFGSHKPLLDIGGGYMWDLQSFLIETRSDMIFGLGSTKSFSFTTTIGGDYVWTSNRNFSLFTGGEFGFGLMHANYVDDHGIRHNGNQNGFAVGGDVGVILFPTSDISMDIRARTLVLTDELNGAVPVMTGLVLGLRF